MGRALLLLVTGLLGACSDASLKTFNAEPKAEIASHADGDEVSEGIPVVLWGSVSDPDHDTKDLLVSWQG